MCYEVYLSTDSTINLSRRNSALVRFERLEGALQDPCVTLLGHPSRWYVGSKSGCSCTFRHLHSPELGFGEPTNWFPEGQDELDATRELHRTLRFLLDLGCRVDLLDRWEGSKPNEIQSIDIRFGEISEKEFRLFENHLFRLEPGTSRDML